MKIRHLLENEQAVQVLGGMTGHVPNKSDSAAADGWEDVFLGLGDPHVADDTNASFNSQISKIFKVEAKRDCFIAMADRWQDTWAVG